MEALEDKLKEKLGKKYKNIDDFNKEELVDALDWVNAAETYFTYECTKKMDNGRSPQCGGAVRDLTEELKEKIEKRLKKKKN